MANKTAVLSVKIISDARKFTKGMDQAAKIVGKFQKSVGKATKLTAAVTAIGTLSSAALAGASNLLALGASLATVAGAGLALPGIIGGFAVGLGVLSLALKDAKTVLADLAPAFGALQDKISGNFWKVAADPIREMVNTLLPRLEGGLGKVATKLGGFFAELAGSLQGALTPGVLKAMFAPLISSIQTAKGAIQPLVQGFVTLGTVGGQYLQPLAEWFVKLSEKFNAFIQQAAADGSLTGWINQGIAGLQTLGSIVGSVVSIFYGLSQAALAAGGAPLQALATGLQGVATAINSPAFQTGLTALFAGAHAAVAGLASGIGSVSGSFAKLMPMIGTVLGIVGQLAGKIISVVVPAFTAIASAVMPAVTVIGGALMNAFTRLSQWFSANQAKIQAFTTEIGTMLVGAVSTLKPILDGLVTTLTNVGTWVLNNKEAVTAMGAALLGAVGAITAIKAAVAAYTVVQKLLNVVMRANPIGLIITAVAALVAGIVYLATQTTFFQTIWAAMTSFVQSAISAVTAFFKSAWNGAKSIFSSVVSTIRNLWNSGMDFVGSVVDSVISGVKSVINSVTGVVSSVISAVRSFFRSGFNAAQNVVQNVISFIKSYIQTTIAVVQIVIAAVRSRFQSGFNAARSIVQSVISAVKSIIEDIRSTVSGVISYVKGIFVDGFNSMRSAAESAISGVVGIIDNITGAVQNAIGWVQDLFSMDGMPGWLGDVLGMGGTGFNIAGAFDMPKAETGIGATGGYSLASVFSTSPAPRRYEAERKAEDLRPIEINVYPAAGMDEEKIANIASRNLYWEMQNR